MRESDFLEELLDGAKVEWLPLSEIAEIYGGLTGKSKADFENGNAKYISYKNIFNNIDVEPSQLELVKVGEDERQNRVRYGDVLFTGSSETAVEAGMSSAVTVDFKEPVYLNSFSFGVRFNNNIKLMPEFSKYLFRSRFMRAEIAKSASGVTRFNVSKARFKKILVPIPCPHEPKKSLAIQKEIVRILDAFTALSTQLTAELTDRNKQYSYYRDQLFAFADGGDVVCKPLDTLGMFQRGKRFVKNDMVAEGVPCIHYGEMYTYYGVWSERSQFFLNEKLASKLRIANSGDVIIVAAGETIEDIGNGTAWLGQDDVVIHDACFSYKSELNPKYVSYFLRTKHFKNQIKMKVSSGKISSINAKGLGSAKIPVPFAHDPEKSLAEQARIVDILDKFDALTNSISEGLPREIELRQKQYEYYRDLLLSFPKPDGETA